MEKSIDISAILSNLEKQKTVAMAYGREDWIDTLKAMLSGVLGEYAKQKYADLVGFKGHCWTPEVKRLMKEVEYHIEETKTKTKFDRQSAIKDAIKRAFLSQLKLTKARNMFMDMSLEYANKIGSTSYGASEMLIELLKEYLPKRIKIKYPNPIG